MAAKEDKMLSASNITASGPGLVMGETGGVCQFNVYTHYIPKDKNDFDPRTELAFSMDGPSIPVPLKVDAVDETRGVMDVTYTPILPGNYSINIKYHGEHINGSPFKVRIEGESIKQFTLTSKVNVYGSNLKTGKVNQTNVIYIDVDDPAIKGGLAASMAGPKGAKVNLKMVEEKETVFKVTYSPTIKGNYLLYVKIANTNVPGSPFSIIVSP
ncbi:filamin-C-like [Panonychus citri]|uniref:filamin-C-like n=1 Tax=Panonychus citri TaxID=50023 RepID=UPI00230803FF|nr:filamin-C-like [Panonychus citri]